MIIALDGEIWDFAVGQLSNREWQYRTFFPTDKASCSAFVIPFVIQTIVDVSLRQGQFPQSMETG